MKRSMIMLEEEEEKCLKKGPWSVEEDIILMSYINIHGDGRWNSLAKFSGLKRSGKSCRLRWVNYLRPDLKRGNITPEEERLIIELQRRWGNRWSKIARHMPGRTDNEIKNYWRTRIRRKLLASGRASATNSTSSTSSSLIIGNNSYQPDANAEAELTASPFTSITNIWPPISQSQINEGHYAVSNPTMQQGCVLLPGEASANEELLGYQKQQRQQKEEQQQEGGMETETGEWGDGLNSTSTDDVRNSFSDKITSTMSVWAWPPYDQSVSMMEMMEMEIDNCFEFPLMSV